MAYKNYQLYRTSPMLSGNMKLDIIVKSTPYNVPNTINSNELIVGDFHIRPISREIPYFDNSDLLTGDHQTNIADFYKYTADKFYDAVIDTELGGDWPLYTDEHTNKFKKNWDDTYWAGTQRMRYNQYGTTHECLIPVWLESAKKIRIDLIFKSAKHKDVEVLRKSLHIQPHSLPKWHGRRPISTHVRFCNYLMNYLNYVGIYEYGDEIIGNNRCINVDFDNKTAFVEGLNVESGSYSRVEVKELTTNLTSIERPLIEANNLICSTYSDHQMITPQLINFNLVFDINDLGLAGSQFLYDSDSFTVSTEVFTSYDGKNFLQCEKRDLYTNHQYVPRLYIESNGNQKQWIPEKPKNALDYLQDYNCIDVIHLNKIVQPICHWSLLEDPEHLFNVYDGFGAYKKEGDKYSYIRHSYGVYSNLADSVTDAYTGNNINWTGTLRYGNENDILDVIHRPEYYIYEDKFLRSTNSGINGIQFEPTSEVKDVYIGLMTTPNYDTYESNNAGPHWNVLDTKYTIAIWLNKWSQVGNVVEDVLSLDDKYSDMDGRWISSNIDHPSPNRSELNSYGLYISMRKVELEENGQPKPVLVVVIWTQCVQKPNHPSAVIQNQSNVALQLNKINEAIKTYVGKYSENQYAQQSELFQNLQILGNLTDSKIIPAKIEFFNTIEPINYREIGFSPREIIYLKNKSNTKYVYRYSGSIIPTMLSLQKSSDGLYYNGPNENYFWYKDFVNPTKLTIVPTRYQQYIAEKIRPHIPSIWYDSIRTKTSDKILNYDSPLELFHSGLDDDNHDVGRYMDTYSWWPEYKWFDKSQILLIPNELTVNKYIIVNTEEEIYNQAFNHIYNHFLSRALTDSNQTLDIGFFKNLYEINYDSIEAKYVDIEEAIKLAYGEIDESKRQLLRESWADEYGNALLYEYSITMKLK